MNKFLAILILFFGLASFATAQTQKVEWQTKVVKISDDIYRVDVIADVEDGWFIYSKDMQEGGPIPTSITLNGNGFTTEGVVEEKGCGLKSFYDDIFEIDIKKYEGVVTYSQLIKVSTVAPSINANVLFMSCDDQRCLPPKRLNLPIQF